MKRKYIPQYAAFALLVAGMVGCAAPAASPTATATQPPPSTPGRPLLPPPGTPLPSLTVMGKRQSTATGDLFTLEKKIEVKSDDHFKDGSVPGVGVGNIFYVQATGNFVVMIKTSPPKINIALPPLTESENPGLDTCPLGVVGYMEFDKDMQPTGKSGYLFCDIGDWNSLLLGKDMYLVKVWNEGPGTSDYWRLYKYDVVTWKKLGTVDIPLDNSHEWSDGPTFSFINGRITLSGEDLPGGKADQRGSHHHFVTTDLQLKGEKILIPPDVPSHCPESVLRQQENGDILMFTATQYFGDVEVLRLDKDWKYKDAHVLRKAGFFPLGAVAYKGLWLVTYYDVSKKPEGPTWPAGNPPVRNVAMAAFDADWNLIQNVMLTDFDVPPEGEGYVESEGCWVELLGNRLYASYAVTAFNAGKNGSGAPIGSQTFVNVYALNR